MYSNNGIPYITAIMSILLWINFFFYIYLLTVIKNSTIKGLIEADIITKKKF